MDVGSASALTLYNYQSALKTYGQGSSSSTGSTQNAAVLQALTNAYASLGSSPIGGTTASDPLATLAGSGSALSPSASGTTTFPPSGLASAMAVVGGLDAASASILFSGSSSKGSGGFSSAAINLNASVALASYAAYQSGIQPGTLGAVASAAAAKVDTTQASSIQSAIQGAQLANFNSMLNLLG